MVQEEIRLTQLSKYAGCAAKQPPGFLFPLLRLLPPITDPSVLVGTATADDAAVYRLTDEIALVLTTDFFTPIVDAPLDFGAVAAANALSDVYAMGGRPVAALSIAGFPDETLSPGVMADILCGAAGKASEAGVPIIGGHTIRSREPIFGLAVTGTVHPDRVVTNAGARPGDALLLTKPLGIGAVTTAAKRGEDRLGAIHEALEVMKMLNRYAAERLIGAGVHAMTDVTGFGLLGHLRGMTEASGVGAYVFLDSIPVIAAARKYIQEGILPGGTRSNHAYISAWVEYANGVSLSEQMLLCDAQTSGGLLAAVDPGGVRKLLIDLREGGSTRASLIGFIEAASPGRIRVELGEDRPGSQAAR